MQLTAANMPASMQLQLWLRKKHIDDICNYTCQYNPRYHRCVFSAIAAALPEIAQRYLLHLSDPSSGHLEQFSEDTTCIRWLQTCRCHSPFSADTLPPRAISARCPKVSASLASNLHACFSALPAFARVVTASCTCCSVSLCDQLQSLAHIAKACCCKVCTMWIKGQTPCSWTKGQTPWKWEHSPRGEGGGGVAQG